MPKTPDWEDLAERINQATGRSSYSGYTAEDLREAEDSGNPLFEVEVRGLGRERDPWRKLDQEQRKLERKFPELSFDVLEHFGAVGQREYFITGYVKHASAARVAKKWKNLPPGWTDESVKKFWKTLGKGTPKHKVWNCVEKMTDNISNPGGFCGGLADWMEPGWRQDKETPDARSQARSYWKGKIKKKKDKRAMNNDLTARVALRYAASKSAMEDVPPKLVPLIQALDVKGAAAWMDKEDGDDAYLFWDDMGRDIYHIIGDRNKAGAFMRAVESQFWQMRSDRADERVNRSPWKKELKALSKALAAFVEPNNASDIKWQPRRRKGQYVSATVEDMTGKLGNIRGSIEERQAQQAGTTLKKVFEALDAMGAKMVKRGLGPGKKKPWIDYDGWAY